MTTINGTITSANPGPALYTAIETAALADGWTLDDTVVIGGNTHKVLKSAAAGNVQNLDWFLDINYPTTGVTGGIRFTPFESYNAGTDQGTRGPFSGTSNTTIDATTYSRYGATGSALETNWANTTSYTGLSHALTTSAFSYRISVTRNRIIALLTNNVSQIAYAGFFTPTAAHASWAGAALFPLVVAKLTIGTASSTSENSAASVTACLTRLPKVAALASSGWGHHVTIPTTTTYIGTQGEGQIGVADSPFTGRRSFAPLRIWGNSSGTSASVPGTSTPGLDELGSLDDVGIGYVLSSSIREDSVTVGAETWYATTPSASATLFFRGI
jgi:hypothetical protein